MLTTKTVLFVVSTFVISPLVAHASCYSLQVVDGLTVVPGAPVRSALSSINDAGLAVGSANSGQTSQAVFFRNEIAALTLQADQSPSTFSLAKSINNSDEIVGTADYSIAGETVSAGFYFKNGEQFPLLPLSGDTTATATFISANGTIVGNSISKSGSRAVKTSRAQNFAFEALTPFNGATVCRAKTASVTGAIFGECENERREALPVRWGMDGAVSELARPNGADEARIFNVNAQEIAVGFSLIQGLAVATSWEGGVPKVVGPLPGDDSSELYGVNESGTMVGYSSDQTTDTFRAVKVDQGRMMDLNSELDAAAPFANLVMANGINNRGQIVGYGELKSGGLRGFVLTPTCR